MRGLECYRKPEITFRYPQTAEITQDDLRGRESKVAKNFMLKVGLVNLAKSGPRVVIRNIIPSHPKGLWSYSIKSHPFLCGFIYFPTRDVILYP